MNREKWLEARRKGLGGSDAGAVLGVNKYKTKLDVYLDKIGEAPPVEDNDAMYWGRVLEDLLADEYTKRTRNTVRRNNAILEHPEHKFMRFIPIGMGNTVASSLRSSKLTVHPHRHGEHLWSAAPVRWQDGSSP